MSARRWILICVLIAFFGIIFVTRSSGFDYARGASVTGGDPQAGKQKIVVHDCHSCHVIPGIEGDARLLGPTLDHWSGRDTILDRWPNNSVNLEKWIRHSEQMLPGTTMRMMSVNEQDAKDIAAYLFSIR